MIAAGLALGIQSVKDKSMWNSEEETRRVWEKVTPFLIKHKKCVKTYWTSKQQMIDLFITGGVVVGMGWDFTAWSLADQGYPIKFVAPKEGCLAWQGGWEIPKYAHLPLILNEDKKDKTQKEISFIIYINNMK